MKLNRAKQSSVSTTSLCSEKESSYDSNPATMLLPTANTTTTFRSFIKTKSQGIMIRKDNGDDDDDEVEQLCDSESSKLDSNECTGAATVPPTPNTPNCPASTSATAAVVFRHPENLVTTAAGLSSSSSGSLSVERPIGATGDDRGGDATSRPAIIESATAETNFPYTEMGSGSYLYEPTQQASDTSSISSSATFITAGGGSNGGNGGNGGQKNGGPGGAAKRNYHRSNHIIPILKPNRFVKHTKQNILFNSGGSGSGKSQKGGHHHHHHQMKKRSNSESVPSLYTSQEICKSLRSDRMVITQPDEDRRRRTIIIEKQKNSFGFTLQTYGIKNGPDIELITYVDEVTYGGPAFRGGMRPGDVILSINGRDVEKADHPTLVGIINSCEKTMRLVVLFEDCIRKIELHLRFIKLQKHLQQKLTQLEILNQREDQILLNAALRTCAFTNNKEPPSHDENCNFAAAVRQGDGGNNHDIDLKQQAAKEKPTTIITTTYKCKSLDVSLNDLNKEQSPYEDLEMIIATGGGDDPSNNKEYSSKIGGTFPRQTYAKTSSSLNTTDSQKIQNEESEILINADAEDCCGDAETALAAAAAAANEGGRCCRRRTTDESENDQHHHNHHFRQSKSLPQSVANSLDCLTNEAYEDDEDLMIQVVQQQPQHRKNFSIASSASSDKDFITKL